MATPFNIPLRKYPRYRQEVTLDTTQYIMDIIWNARGAFWSISLFDRDQNPIIEGVKMVFDYDIFKMYLGTSGMPEGGLIFTDPTGNLSRADYDNVESFILSYISNE